MSSRGNLIVIEAMQEIDMRNGCTIIGKEYVYQLIGRALEEDIGPGDITAALVDQDSSATATIISREPGIVCGIDFVNATLLTLDPRAKISWQVHDGDKLEPNSALCFIQGSAPALLTAERTALNFLQLLSGTASTSRYYANQVAHTGVKLLDTRKTIPGLRLAQKYAVTCGGCHNHRIGLFDGFLIKENHIIACGGITAAIQTARCADPDKPIEIEIESLDEMEAALVAGADRIMLDNFCIDTLQEAVKRNAGRAELEASGNVTNENLVAIAETGVDLISIGALTKHVSAIDLSMRITEDK